VLVELQGLWTDALHPPVMEPLGMAARGFEQTGHRIFAHLDQFGRGADATALVPVLNNGHRLGLWDFGVEEGRAPPFGEFLLALAAAEQSELVTSRYFYQVASPRLVKPLALWVDTG
jgi:hypothetical protein